MLSKLCIKSSILSILGEVDVVLALFGVSDVRDRLGNQGPHRDT